MENNTHFFAYISRLPLIARWSLMRNCRAENDAEHSMFTSVVAHALGLIGNHVFGKQLNPERLAVLALYHDAHEVLTGDMPTPIKHNNPAIRDAYKAVETEANARLLQTIPAVLREEYRYILEFDPASEEGKLVKAADTISAYVKCVEECSMGNSDFQSAKESTAKRLKDMHIPEVDWFMENFGDSFGKTIDTL